VAILGTGKAKYEAMVKAMGKKNPKFKGVVKFSAPLAHQITAGADFILVPSRCVWVCADTLSSFAGG
jgi:granule-bound starch synthase